MSLERFSSGLVWFAMLIPFLCRLAFADIGNDGLCPLYIFVPFTMGGVSHMAFTFGDNGTNDGFSYLASAVMAAKHFNERNSSMIKKLEDYLDCPVQIDLENSLVFNTDGGFSHNSSRHFFLSQQNPCAMVGPFSDFPSVELSVHAQSAQIPLITARSYSLRVVSDVYSPFTTSVFPDAGASAREVVKYLLYQNRSNYIYLLYSLSEAGYQRREAIGFELDERRMRWMSSAYVGNEATGGEDSTSRSYFAAVQAIKDSGFRTIVIAMNNPLIELQAIADAAEELAMNQGDYFYVFYDVMDFSFVMNPENENIEKLLIGAAWIIPLSEDFADDSAYWKSWYEQGDDLVDILNAINPMKPGEEGFIFASSDFFELRYPEYGSAFYYDAVMTAGIGACQALAKLNGTTNGTLSGEAHQRGIRQSNFLGISGNVSFGRRNFFLGGARKLGTTLWGAIKMEKDAGFNVTDRIWPGGSGLDWVNIRPFHYADGAMSPPALLRDVPEQNYLSPWLRLLGFTLMGISAVSAACACAWVFLCSKHRILSASQPFFLYIICFGALVQTSTIVSISFDESYGWNKDQLSKACMSIPWLLSLGHVIVYSALFTKLWRVNKVLSFSRRKVQIRNVVAPMVVLFVAAIVILVLWTVLDPLQWNRREINEDTGESIGGCHSINIGIFIGPLLIIMIIPTILTGVMAYKTKDVDAAYSESWWDFVLMLVQVEVILFSAPVIAILRDESTDGKYLGLTFLIWSFPMSTLTLIFIPKALAYWQAKKGIGLGRLPKRGESHGIRVTGVSESTNNQSAWHHNSGEQLSMSMVEVMEQPTTKGSMVSNSSCEERYGHDTPSVLMVVPEDQEISISSTECSSNTKKIIPENVNGFASNDKSHKDENCPVVKNEEASP